MHRIGVIGLGVMGRRMIEALDADRRFEVVAGFDPHPPQKTDGLALRADAAAVIGDPAIDCVYIASPPASHLGLVEAAAAAGKAIFCEKPLTVSIAEADACVAAVRRADVAAAVNFPFATAPSVLRLRDLMAGGALGDVRSARLTLRFASWPRGWQTGASGWLAGPAQGGFVREVGSHFLFLAHRLFGAGKLAETTLERGSAGTETRARAVVRYSGVMLEIDASVEGDIEDFNRFEIVGSRGTAAVTDWYRLDHDGVVSDRTPPLPHQVDGLARLLDGDATQPLATFAEAAAVVALVERILSA